LTTPADLRERFARGRFIERALERNYPCCVKYRRLRTLATEPRDVESITLRFVDHQGTLIFVLHCYLHPNGDLGASGLFDPKYLLDDGGMAYRAP
jgi:hypothetical protein